MHSRLCRFDFEQNDPHPDPLPSDGRGNSLIRLLHLLQRLDMPTDGGRFSLFHPMGYLFSVVDARVAGARRLRRFRMAQTHDVTEKTRLRKSLTVKRPEGRAPVQIVVGALNTYPMGEGRAFAAPKRLRPRRRGEGESFSKSEVVFARVLSVGADV
jgi:hypothetical protein